MLNDREVLFPNWDVHTLQVQVNSEVHGLTLVLIDCKSSRSYRGLRTLFGPVSNLYL